MRKLESCSLPSQHRQTCLVSPTKPQLSRNVGWVALFIRPFIYFSPIAHHWDKQQEAKILFKLKDNSDTRVRVKASYRLFV